MINVKIIKNAVDAVLNKKKILSTSYSGKTEDIGTANRFDIVDTVIVKKQRGKDFIILNLTDIHFSDYDYRAFFAFESTMTAKQLVRRVKPDLITVTGDIVCGDSTHFSIQRFTNLMNSFGTPWAPVFGNHDGEANCDKNHLADIMMQSPYCLMKKGDPEMGVGNYCIGIAHEKPDGTPDIVEALIMLDSHSTQANPTQVAWYSRVCDEINRYSDNNAEIAAFFHVPLAQYRYAYDELFDAQNKVWKNGCGGYGDCFEKICCEYDSDGIPVDRGLFEAIKKSGTTKHVICGHEHMNDFSVLYKGIRLTYTLKIGFGSGFQKGFNGGTVITVGENGIKRITHKSRIGPRLKNILSIDTK